MELVVTFMKNIESQMYDVVVTSSTSDLVYETICSCKTSENAQWIVDLIKKDGVKNG